LGAFSIHKSLQILLALGGKKRIAKLLRGRLWMSWHYTRRLADVEATHKELGPQASFGGFILLPGCVPRVLAVAALQPATGRR